MIRNLAALALWIVLGSSVLAGCRSDTTRPRDVAPTPKVAPKASPYPFPSAQPRPDSSARTQQSADSATNAMPSIRLIWPDSSARKPASPR